jgi:pimeloyl-ACP methyl ester carboxylesterase
MNKGVAVFAIGLIATGVGLLWNGHRYRAKAIQRQGTLHLQPCSPGYAEGALCGTYEVWEDRKAKTGRKIGLNVVVLPATGTNRSADPVFWLEGGPGAAATDSARDERRGLFSAVRVTRDLIFVDQRGTGGSKPLLCSFNDDPRELRNFLGGALFPRDKIRACRESLEQTANLRLYTTPVAMDDLDEVRQALGYDKINVAGASYGTLAAQIYMRQHPEHIRTAFLAGVATPNIKQPLLFPRAAQLALDEVLKDCVADKNCHANFPGVGEEFASVMARFDKGPVRMDLVDPTTKQKVTIDVLRESFAERLRLALYTTGTARFVPYVIHRAYAGDYVPFEVMALATNVGGGIARGMYMTVTCAEGVPFITESDIVRETRGTFVGEDRVRAHIEACKEWPRGDVPTGYTELVKSDLPVLMISGEADGASPPWYAEAAVRNFSNGRQVKIPHYGHQTSGPCVAGLFKTFIEKGTAQGIDASCAAEARRPPFATELPKQFALQ